LIKDEPDCVEFAKTIISKSQDELTCYEFCMSISCFGIEEGKDALEQCDELDENDTNPCPLETRVCVTTFSAVMDKSQDEYSCNESCDLFKCTLMLTETSDLIDINDIDCPSILGDKYDESPNADPCDHERLNGCVDIQKFSNVTDCSGLCKVV